MKTVRVAAPFALLALSVRGLAQSAPPPVLSPAAARVQADVAFLASDDLKGRRSGTPEGDRAAAWVAEQFRRIGLAPGAGNGAWLQPFAFIDGVDLGPKNRLETAAGARKAWTAGADFRPLAFSAAGVAEGDVVSRATHRLEGPGTTTTRALTKDCIVLVLRYGPDGDDEKSSFSIRGAALQGGRRARCAGPARRRARSRRTCRTTSSRARTPRFGPGVAVPCGGPSPGASAGFRPR